MRHATRLLDTIQRLDPEGQFPIVGVEPSELYTLRDEFNDLHQERAAEMEVLRARTFLVDEYLVRLSADLGKK